MGASSKRANASSAKFFRVHRTTVRALFCRGFRTFAQTFQGTTPTLMFSGQFKTRAHEGEPVKSYPIPSSPNQSGLRLNTGCHGDK